MIFRSQKPPHAVNTPPMRVGFRLVNPPPPRTITPPTLRLLLTLARVLQFFIMFHSRILHGSAYLSVWYALQVFSFCVCDGCSCWCYDANHKRTKNKLADHHKRTKKKLADHLISVNDDKTLSHMILWDLCVVCWEVWASECV